MAQLWFQLWRQMAKIASGWPLATVLVLLRLHTSPSQRSSMHERLPCPALAVTLVQTLGHIKPQCLLRPGSVDTSPLVCIVHPYLQSTFRLVSFLHARIALTPYIYTERWNGPIKASHYRAIYGLPWVSHEWPVSVLPCIRHLRLAMT